MIESHLRIRSIRPKDGSAEVRVLYSKDPDISERVATCGPRMLASAGTNQLVGYCLFAWRADGTAYSLRRAGNGNQIPAALLPDFIRNALLADTASDWAIEAFKTMRPR